MAKVIALILASLGPVVGQSMKTCVEDENCVSAPSSLGDVELLESQEMGALHTELLQTELLQRSTYVVPPLTYAYDALNPVINTETMHLHHDKHNQAYVDNLNAAFEGMEQPPLLHLLKDAITNGDATIRNNGGGVYNHAFYWEEMAPPGTGGQPSAQLLTAIDSAFGNFTNFQAEFESAGAGQFGSGWAWLVVKADGTLAITATPNQDDPLMQGVDATEGIPILGVDVWEHAYYLKYKNVRADYLAAWWAVVNWNKVNAWYQGALGGIKPSFPAAEGN